MTSDSILSHFNMPPATNDISNGTNGNVGHALDMTVLGLNSGTSMVSFPICNFQQLHFITYEIL
jgi:hypothetical protein